MSGTSRVLIDANVFYSRTLTDWMCMLSMRGSMFDVCWTEDILAEARYHLRKDKPSVSDGYLTARFDRIRVGLFPEGRISGFDIVDKAHGDPHDWHVVNAARHGDVGYLVTDDAKFSELVDNADLEFETHTADTFLMLVDDSSPDLVRKVTAEQQEYWISKTACRSLPRALTAAGAPAFAERIQQRLQELQL